MPHHYDLPNHLARIFDSAEFEAARKEVDKTLHEFRDAVEAELKALTQEQRRDELKNFEELVGAKALSSALEKFRGGVEAELKSLVSRHRADSLAKHEAAATKHVLAAAKKRA